jgi:hypothetical protein
LDARRSSGVGNVRTIGLRIPPTRESAAYLLAKEEESWTPRRPERVM